MRKDPPNTDDLGAGPREPFPAECFQCHPQTWEYVFPIDLSRTGTHGVPVMHFEPIYKRGRIVRLLVSYHQTPNHGDCYVIVVGGKGSDSLWFVRKVGADYDMRTGWCSHHKTAYIAVPCPAPSFRISVHSSITVWMGEPGG